MPLVQLTAIYEKQDEQLHKFKEKIKRDQIVVALNELTFAIETCNIPTEVELMDTRKDNQLEWNAKESFSKFNNQSNESYYEQRLAVENFQEGIENYLSLSSYNKCRVTHGAPGSGKLFILQYILIAFLCIAIHFSCILYLWLLEM